MFPADLLARGLTIGQTMKLLFTPYHRPKPEEEGKGTYVHKCKIYKKKKYY